MNLETPYIVAVYGIPKSGKSHLIKYLVYQSYIKDQFDFYLVVTGTKFNGSYQEFINKKFVHNYSEKIIKKLLKKSAQWKENEVDVRTLLILDDVLGESNFNDGLFTKLINNYRHYNISMIIASQYINKIPPNFRSNVKYAFIFNQTTERALTAAYDSYFISHYTFDEMKKLFTKLKRYECFFISTEEYDKSKKFRKFIAPEKIAEFYISNQ